MVPHGGCQQLSDLDRGTKLEAMLSRKPTKPFLSRSRDTIFGTGGIDRGRHRLAPRLRRSSSGFVVAAEIFTSKGSLSRSVAAPE